MIFVDVDDVLSLRPVYILPQRLFGANEYKSNIRHSDDDISTSVKILSMQPEADIEWGVVMVEGPMFDEIRASDWHKMLRGIRCGSLLISDRRLPTENPKTMVGYLDQSLHAEQSQFLTNIHESLHKARIKSV